MRRLPIAVKRRVVEHLACYNTHSMVAELIAEEFGIQMTPRHVRAYDPKSPQFVGAIRWLEYYQFVRKRYGQVVGEVAVAHRVYRILQLQHILDGSMNRAEYRLALKALEQAAKEMGNWYAH